MQDECTYRPGSARPKRRKPWAEQGMSYWDWCLKKSEERLQQQPAWKRFRLDPATSSVPSIPGKPSLADTPHRFTVDRLPSGCVVIGLPGGREAWRAASDGNQRKLHLSEV